MKLVFATSNKAKFSILERELKIAGMDDCVVLEQNPLDLTEIQSMDIAAISLFKAKQAYDVLKCPVLVHDGGFYINGLNGFPGAYTRDMITTVGAETMARIVSVLDDRTCQFRNVATLMLGPDTYHQFFDSSLDIFTLTEKIWPHDHPRQLSPMWRILVASKFGYDRPMASLNDAEIDDYYDKRHALENGSSIQDAVMYLKEQLSQQAA